MTPPNPFFGAARNIGEHIAALMFVSVCETARHWFLIAFGHDYRSWPGYVVVALAFLLYLIGFFSAALVRTLIRRRRERRGRVPPSTKDEGHKIQAGEGHPSQAELMEPDTSPERESPAVAVAVATSIVAAVSIVALARLGRRKP